MNHSQTQFWSVPSFELLEQLQTTPQGLRSDEIPYDFIRKRLSILTSKGDAHLMVTKGALSNVLADGNSVDCWGDDYISIHSTCRALRFSTLANDDPPGHRHNCGALYDCSRNNKKILLQKGKFLKRYQQNKKTGSIMDPC